MAKNWKSIIGYEGYEISYFGEVLTPRGRILKPGLYSGYLGIYLSRSGKTTFKTIHRLVAEAFIPNPDNLSQVNHKDEDKLNNYKDNLEWVTPLINCKYSNDKPVEGFTSGTVILFESLTVAATEVGAANASVIGNSIRYGTQCKGMKWRYV